MDPMTLATIAKVGGDLVTNLMNKPKVRSPRETILSTVQGAREAGIHPLAALGASPQYTTVSGGVSTGSAIGQAISGVGSAIEQREAASPTDALTKASTEAQLAQAELFRAQSRSIMANTANAAIGGPQTKGSGPPRWDSSKQDTDAPMNLLGFDITPPASGVSTERAQEWFGEPGEWIQGLNNLLFSKTTVSKAQKQEARRLLRDIRSWYVRNRGESAPGPMP